MVRRVASRVVVFPNLDAASDALARRVVANARAAVRDRGSFSLVISGGHTPAGLFRRLAGAVGRRLPWKATDVYFADERCVPPGDPDSNFGAARETLLSRVPVAARRVHRLRGEVRPPSREAARYSRLIGPVRRVAPRFDMVILGLGPDGHTASLFPGEPATRERRRAAVAVRRSSEPPFIPRLTLTAPALSSARNVYFLVAGSDKAAALRATFRAGARGDPMHPASLVRPARPAVWFLDRAAARGSRSTAS